MAADIRDAFVLARNRIREDGPLKYRYDRAEDYPSQRVLSALQVRLDGIANFLEPASRLLIEAEITSLFGVMAVKDVDPKDRLAEMRVWRDDFLRAGLSGYAVSEACARFRCGDRGDSKGKFKPAPGEVIQEARRIEADHRKEHREIYAVLNADVPAPKIRDPEKAKAQVAYWENVIKPAMLAAADMGRVSRKRRADPSQPLPERADPPPLSAAAARTYAARAPSDAIRKHVEEHGA